MAPSETVISSQEESQSQEALRAKQEAAEQEAFQAFTLDTFRKEAASNTINLHYLLADPSSYGITDYPLTLGTVTAHTEETASSLQNMQDTLNEFQYDLLSDEQKVTYDVLEHYLAVEAMGADYPLYYEPLSPNIGIQSQLPVLLAEYAFYSEKDVTDYLGLLDQVDDYFAQILEFEQQKAQAGLFMNDVLVDQVIAGCRDFIAVPANNYLITVFNEKIETVPNLTEEAIAQYRQANEEAVLNQVIPAYQTLVDGLYNLKGSGINQGGLCGLPEGKAYYEYLVARYTGSSRSVEELIELTLQKLEEDIRSASLLNYKTGGLTEAAGAFSFSLSDPQEILDYLKSSLDENFPALPDTSCTLKYVDPSMEDSSSPAFYLTPPMDRLSDNVIYINQAKISESSGNRLFPTLAHEGYPGHLYQTVYTSTVCTDPLRQLISWPGYSEGWASYVEFMAYEMDPGVDKDTASFMSLNASASLALYALMDFYINYEGYGIPEISQFLKQWFAVEDETVVREVYYLIAGAPANYLKYYIGYLEICLLKEDAKNLWGDDFTLKDFHTFFLDMGEAPFDVIRDHMPSSAPSAS